jgi:hypothetical protein
MRGTKTTQYTLITYLGVQANTDRALLHSIITIRTPNIFSSLPQRLDNHAVILLVVNLALPALHHPFRGGNARVSLTSIEVDAVDHVGWGGDGAFVGRHGFGQFECLVSEAAGPGERDVVVFGAAGVVRGQPAVFAGGGQVSTEVGRFLFVGGGGDEEGGDDGDGLHG